MATTDVLDAPLKPLDAAYRACGSIVLAKKVVELNEAGVSGYFASSPDPYRPIYVTSTGVYIGGDAPTHLETEGPEIVLGKVIRMMTLERAGDTSSFEEAAEMWSADLSWLEKPWNGSNE